MMVDMEEGVLDQLCKSDLAELFEPRQRVHDSSGCGNNWAVGYHHYGPQHRHDICAQMRREAEECDSLQSFFLVHSIGGGTGSGLGSFLLQSLEEEFPDVHRICLSVFPSQDDDVITSPYNR
jgi:tubulin epsilon